MNQIPKVGALLESESFRERTAMYIGENKISCLKSFIDGVQYAIDAYEIKEEWVLDGFHDWVANYYGWNESTAGWKEIILKEHKGDKRASVKAFFRLFDEFRKGKN